MDHVYLTASIGLIGVGVGSLTSFCTAWWTHNTRLREANLRNAHARRERLVRDFIHEASRAYGDALSRERDDVAGLVRLYALIAEMRLVASSQLVSAAESVLTKIIDTYLAPNLTLHELRAHASLGGFDFLRDFGTACLDELATLSP